MNILRIIKNPISFLAILSMILLAACIGFWRQAKKLKDEKLAYRHNVSVLMESIDHYTAQDSLNAIHVKELQLSLKEYKKYRKEDAELIKKLKADKLTSSIHVTSKSDTKIKTQVRDSIVYKDTLKTIHYNSRWTDVHGYIDKDTALLKITNREELLIAESIQRKKFLGIKLPIWLFGYKHKTVDITSKNPNTTITSTEYVNIR